MSAREVASTACGASAVADALDYGFAAIEVEVECKFASVVRRVRVVEGRP